MVVPCAMQVAVTREALEAMMRAAREAAPDEACGILFGDQAKVTRFVRTRNVHPRPQTHFEIDPQALIDAHRDARGGRTAILGYFHSHPEGPPSPSKSDEQLAAGDGAIWAIWGEDEIQFYKSGKCGFEALPMTQIEG